MTSQGTGRKERNRNQHSSIELEETEIRSLKSETQVLSLVWSIKSTDAIFLYSLLSTVFSGFVIISSSSVFPSLYQVTTQ